MKKILSILLVTVISISLGACGNVADDSTDTGNEEVKIDELSFYEKLTLGFEYNISDFGTLIGYDINKLLYEAEPIQDEGKYYVYYEINVEDAILLFIGEEASTEDAILSCITLPINAPIHIFDFQLSPNLSAHEYESLGFSLDDFGGYNMNMPTTYKNSPMLNYYYDTYALTIGSVYSLPRFGGFNDSFIEYLDNSTDSLSDKYMDNTIQLFNIDSAIGITPNMHYTYEELIDEANAIIDKKNAEANNDFNTPIPENPLEYKISSLNNLTYKQLMAIKADLYSYTDIPIAVSGTLTGIQHGNGYCTGYVMIDGDYAEDYIAFQSQYENIPLNDGNKIILYGLPIDYTSYTLTNPYSGAQSTHQTFFIDVACYDIVGTNISLTDEELEYFSGKYDAYDRSKWNNEETRRNDYIFTLDIDLKNQTLNGLPFTINNITKYSYEGKSPCINMSYSLDSYEYTDDTWKSDLIWLYMESIPANIAKEGKLLQPSDVNGADSWRITCPDEYSLVDAN